MRLGQTANNNMLPKLFKMTSCVVCVCHASSHTHVHTHMRALARIDETSLSRCHRAQARRARRKRHLHRDARFTSSWRAFGKHIDGHTRTRTHACTHIIVRFSADPAAIFALARSSARRRDHPSDHRRLPTGRAVAVALLFCIILHYNSHRSRTHTHTHA